jgi:sugar O-acyltransferase (sialic acid O-acetyltransferase NeuD family)
MPDSSAKQAAILIVGAGGHGREVASYIRALERSSGEVRLAGFIDDNATATIAGIPVLSTVDELLGLVGDRPPGSYKYITALGNNTVRANIVKRLAAIDIEPWTVCHPAAIVGERVEIGEGSCLAPGVVLTTDVRIGKHCIVNVGASVSHDSVVSDYCNLNPGVKICGTVSIGTGSFIGAGATVINNICIGEGCIVGAGAVVIRDLPAHVTAVGVPARVVKHHG